MLVFCKEQQFVSLYPSYILLEKLFCDFTRGGDLCQDKIIDHFVAKKVLSIQQCLKMYTFSHMC